jgi:ferredoxin-NADP reductase
METNFLKLILSESMISTIGSVVLIVIFIYLILLIYSQIKLNKSLAEIHSKELDTLVERSGIILFDAKQDAIDEHGAWQGQRKFEIVDKVLEADSIRSFYLAPHDRKPLPSFRPGQFLTFYLTIPGTDTETTVRCYSLSDAPTHDDYYRVSIKQLGPPPKKPDAPPGLSSNYFHDNLEIGSLLNVMAPAGDFYIKTSADAPVVLIGGGIGLTPVLSMLNTIVDTGSTRETWFFYGTVNGEQHAFKEHLNKFRDIPNINIVICYSNPEDGDVLGEDYDVKGWVGVPLFKEKLNSNNYDFYMCGPPPMMNAVVNGLDEWGVPEEKIHFEAFGPASVKKSDDKPAAATGESFEINFERSGKKVTWDGSHNNLWDFANANDVAIAKGCGAGNCGTCITALREGDVNYDKKPAFRYEKGCCLVCCCKPKGPLTIDA